MPSAPTAIIATPVAAVAAQNPPGRRRPATLAGGVSVISFGMAETLVDERPSAGQGQAGSTGSQ